MERFIYHHQWHFLTDDELTALFTEIFIGVSVLPYLLLPILKAMKVATLECLEHRTLSTVYRIRQTGIVYHLQALGTMVEYGDWEDYCIAAAGDDSLVAQYATKEPVFVIKEQHRGLLIERKQPPRFIAEKNGRQELVILKWIDQEPESYKRILSLKLKAEAFVKHYYKGV